MIELTHKELAVIVVDIVSIVLLIVVELAFQLHGHLFPLNRRNRMIDLWTFSVFIYHILLLLSQG
jgi:hypothetical protein